MSSWGFEGEENALSSWSSVSQFDDMVWDEFAQSGDRVVSEPEKPTENGWMQNSDKRKRLHKDAWFAAAGGSEVREEVEGTTTSQVENLDDSSMENAAWSGEDKHGSHHSSSWSVLLEAPTVESSRGMLSEELDLYMDNSGFAGNNGTMLDTNCPFPLPDVGPTDDDIELFGGSGDVEKGGNLLSDYSWENIDNLEDVDKLFGNKTPSFGQALSDTADAVQWAVSPTSFQGNSATEDEMSPSNLEYAAVKGKLWSYDVKMDFVPCHESVVLPRVEKEEELHFEETVDGGNHGQSSLQNNSGQPEQIPPLFEGKEGKESSGRTGGDVINSVVTASEGADEAASLSRLSSSEPDKAGLAQAHRARRHAANRRRSELRRQCPPRKLVRWPAQVGHLHPATLHGFPAAPSPSASVVMGDPQVQSSPHSVPYIQAGYGTPFPHQIYVGYQQPSPRPQKLPLDQGHLSQLEPFVPLRPPPVSSPTMTPQDKLDKLRWRQQMQAQLAVQQQRQQLVAQQMGLEQLRKQRHQQEQQQEQQQQQQQHHHQEEDQEDEQEDEQDALMNEDSADGMTTLPEEEDDSLEAVVLRELETTMRRLDVNTRVCIRDALFRLARSAKQRRASGESGSSCWSSEGINGSVKCGVESSSSSNLMSATKSSRVANILLLETETNPIDRSIANLLFHKRLAHPPSVPVYMPSSED